jgi:hypothetical protein
VGQAIAVCGLSLYDHASYSPQKEAVSHLKTDFVSLLSWTVIGLCGMLFVAGLISGMPH